MDFLAAYSIGTGAVKSLADMFGPSESDYRRRNQKNELQSNKEELEVLAEQREALQGYYQASQQYMTDRWGNEMRAINLKQGERSGNTGLAYSGDAEFYNDIEMNNYRSDYYRNKATQYTDYASTLDAIDRRMETLGKLNDNLETGLYGGNAGFTREANSRGILTPEQRLRDIENRSRGY